MNSFSHTFTLSWDGIEILARHSAGDDGAADLHGEPLDCIEIEAIGPAGAWLPAGFAGGAVHRVSRARIARFGDAGGYIAAWLEALACR